jgi:ribose-phosphate pyrophosphokinase
MAVMARSMVPVLLSGSGNAPLSAAIAQSLGWSLGKSVLERFPDGELHVEIQEEIRGRDVYVVQSLKPPAEYYLLELLFLADAARRAGARHLVAVLPYLAYARQDRRVTGREPVGARVMAELIEGAGFDRVVVLDLHSPAVEGCFGVPLEHLSAIPSLAAELRDRSSHAVLVSPDLGGVKRAEAYARLLDLPVVVVHKSRMSGIEVTVRRLVGEVRGCSPIIVDDMISTGGTMEAAIQALLDAGCSRDITVAVTHPLFVADAAEKLARLPIRRLVTTDTLPPQPSPLPIRRVSVAPLLAHAIRGATGSVPPGR